MKQGVGVAGLFLQCSSYPEFQNPSAVGQNMRAKVTCGEGCVCELRVPKAVLKD